MCNAPAISRGSAKIVEDMQRRPRVEETMVEREVAKRAEWAGRMAALRESEQPLHPAITNHAAALTRGEFAPTPLFEFACVYP